MSDHQLLDLLADGAPAPAPGLADDVIERAHKNRHRRWAVSGACAAVALVAAVPLAVALNRSPQSARPATPVASSHAPVSRGPSDTTQVYAASIKYLANQLVRGKRWRVLYISDQACRTGFGVDGPCPQTPIPATIQRELSTALRSYARVQFVAPDAKIRDKNLSVINDGIAVTLGRIHLRGSTAQVPLWVQCGGLCGLGQTLKLAKTHGQWTVTGTTGEAVIS